MLAMSVKEKRIMLIYSRISNIGTLPWIPIGLLYIAAVLKKNGFVVKIHDRNKSSDDLFSVIDDFCPDVIGIGAMTVQSDDAISLSCLLKEHYPDILLCMGGVHFTFCPEDGLNKGAADLVVIGEGEYTMLEICQGKAWNTIDGIAFKDITGAVIKTSPRAFIRDLDELPYPAYELVDVTSYDDQLITGEKAISLLTGRGCPMSCTFCASPLFWQRKIRLNSIQYAVEHIKFLVDTYGIKNIRVMDDTFTVSRRRVLDFCQQIKGLNLNLTCLTNVRNSDADMLKEMKASGFSIVAYGIECANQRVLDAVEKGITLQRAIQAIENAKSAGLVVELLFMIGNITETEETIIDSIEFARKYNQDGCNWFQFSTPFPGSVFATNAEEYGRIISWDMDEWDHQKPVFIPHGLNEETMIGLRHVAINGGEILREKEKDPVVVFGTGSYFDGLKGHIFSRFSVLFYMDNNQEKSGCELFGKKIMHPGLITDFPRVRYIIASSYWRAIGEQLLGAGISASSISVIDDSGALSVIP